MRVFITGINGFIGSALAKSLLQRGHEVVGSVSTKEKLADASHHSSQCFVIALNQDFDPKIFRGVDTIVHCAYDLRKGMGATNKEGTEKIARAAMNEGVKRQLYIGSYSAHEKATSEYGLTKLELEKFFLSLGQTVVKPGLVIGHGGIFLKMSRFVQNYPLVPLIDGGKGKVPIVGIRDLTASLVQLIEDPRPGCFRLYNDEQATFKEVMAHVKKAGGFKTVMIPVPYHFVYAGLWLSDKLRLPIQLDIGNLKGFRANQLVGDRSDLRQFVPQPMSLAEMIMYSIAPH